MNLRREVAKQLNFIVSSCEQYDKGHHEDAIRIATATRVLFNETKSQRSLIRSHCNRGDIKLRSTTMLNRPDGHEYPDLGFLDLELFTGNFRPMLAKTKRNEPLPFDEWWKEPVLKLEASAGGENVTREQIVLLAADKDGGAHVDNIKPVWYERLSCGLEYSAEFHMASGRKIIVNFKNANLAALRQIGYELLASEELTCLAQK